MSKFFENLDLRHYVLVAWGVLATWGWLHVPAQVSTSQAPAPQPIQAVATAKAGAHAVVRSFPCPQVQVGDKVCPQVHCPDVEVLSDAEAQALAEERTVVVNEHRRRIGVDFASGLAVDQALVGLHGDIYRAGPFYLGAGVQVPLTALTGNGVGLVDTKGVVKLDLELPFWKM